MAKNNKDWVIKLKLDPKQFEKDYDRVVKRLEKKVIRAKTSVTGTSRGRGGGTGGGRTRSSQSQITASTRERFEESIKALKRRMKGEHLGKEFQASMDKAFRKVEGIEEKLGSAKTRREVYKLREVYKDVNKEVQNVISSQKRHTTSVERAKKAAETAAEREARRTKLQVQRAELAAYREDRIRNRPQITPAVRERFEERIGATRGRAANFAVGPELRGAMDNAIGRLDQVKQRLSVAKTRREVYRLQEAYRDVNDSIRKIVRSQERYNKSVQKANAFTDRFSKSAISAATGIASAYAVLSAGRWTYRVGKEMDAMRASLLMASQDAESAGNNFLFLKNTADTLGRDIQSMTSGFNRIAIAARSAGFNAAETKEIFMAASEASAAVSLDQQRTGLVMLAFSQIMSKGRVSMEEMSRQLGENLPIALKAMENATGNTTEELIKMIESGKLLAKDVMLPFSRELRRMSRENNALAASQNKLIAQENRLTNAFKNLADSIFQDGFAEALGTLFGAIADITNKLSPLLRAIMKPLSMTVTVVFDIIRAFIEMIDTVYHVVGGLFNIGDAADDANRSLAGLLTVMYSILYASSAIRLEFEKLDASLPDWLGTAMGSGSVTGFGYIADIVDAFKGGDKGKTVNVRIDRVETRTTSSDPNRHAEEMLSSFSQGLQLLSF